MYVKGLLQALVLGGTIAAGLATTAAFGATSDDQVQKLIERIDAQDRRIAELEQALETAGGKDEATVPATAAKAAPPAASWADKLQLKGDLRLRQENIDAEGKSSVSRQRVRARVAIVARPDDNLELGFGLATGGDSPVSANQTLGEGYSKKGVDVDLAYIDWAIVPDVHLVGGKMKNPFHRTGDNGLVWDSDLRPEGASIRWDNGRLFAVGGMFTPARDSGGSSEYVSGAQLGGRLQFSDSVILTLGASYFDLSDVKGGPLLYTDDDSAGNTVLTDLNGDLVYATGFKEVEAFAELAMNMGKLPISLFFDYVNNTDADELNTGWAVGFTLGEAADKGSWAVSYVYEDLEADAVLGLFTDSDFGGGGTDVKGHILGAAYALSKRTNLAMTWFINKTDQSSATERDYDRLQLDINFKY
ncbi:MAG: hypothetical protein DYH20_01470 [Gammaproteobacteria bacterium PRO9]|nr:hypothetical protein [Gammaproteobacteria bacterium PRO9]